MHMERALSTVLREGREALGVLAAGRTDAGVHARGQVRALVLGVQPGRPLLLPANAAAVLMYERKRNTGSA
jgi:tRNA U38,U39,U40 pseudouridine synthase TruA